MTYNNVVWAIIILAFLTAFAIGANDAANALATSYGSNALKLIYLVLLGGVFEFIGAYYCSSHVSGTLVSSIIQNVDEQAPEIVQKMMLGTSISSFLFIMCSSVFGMPISGTHTVVGALIGSGIAASGSGTINWDKLSVIVGSWFIAPAVAAVLSLIIMTVVAASTLNSKVRLATRLIWVTVISAFSSSIIAVMVISITKDTKDPFTAWHWTILGVAAVIGIVTSRLILLGLTLGQEKLTCEHVMSAVL